LRSNTPPAVDYTSALLPTRDYPHTASAVRANFHCGMSLIQQHYVVLNREAITGEYLNTMFPSMLQRVRMSGFCKRDFRSSCPANFDILSASERLKIAPKALQPRLQDFRIVGITDANIAFHVEGIAWGQHNTGFLQKIDAEFS